MGNSPSRRSSLTRELEKFANPTGLYPKCTWDVRVVRRLVVEKKVAPRFSGRDTMESCFTQECPICFMFYPGALNVVTCCAKSICTECFLQLKPPSKQVNCPFCNRKSLAIKYTEPNGLNLAMIHAATSYKNPPAVEHGEEEEEGQSMAVHFASAEDRQRIRDDLRSQLNLPERSMTTVTPPSVPMIMSTAQQITRRHSEHLSQQHLTRQQNPQRNSLNYLINSAEEAARLASEAHYIIASAADAARLEEMMMMEAIRRSMRDVTVGSDQEEVASVSLATQPTQVMIENTVLSPQRRPSTNRFDAPLSPYRVQSPQRRVSTNLFDPPLSPYSSSTTATSPIVSRQSLPPAH